MKLRYSDSSRFALYPEIQLMLIFWSICTRRANAKNRIAGDLDFLILPLWFTFPKRHSVQEMFCDHILATSARVCYAGATWWEGPNAEGIKKTEKTGNLCIIGSKGHCGTQVSWWPGITHALVFPEIYQTSLSICGGLLHMFASERQETCQLHQVSYYVFLTCS